MSLAQRPRHRIRARRTFFSFFSTARHALRRSRLWKIAGGALAALLAIGMVATGVSLSATAAGGSGDPTPYTVTAQGVTLPTGVTFPSDGHVNYTATKLDGTGLLSFGVHFDPNNKQPGGRFIGQAFFPFSNVGADDKYDAVTSSAASAFPNGYCITWVQVSMYNEHFGEGGQSPICTDNTVKSTGLYLYKKLDASKPASWENSGKQTRIATWDGWSFATVYPGTLPSNVCGDGWAVQQDQVKGAQSIFPLNVTYPVDKIGWPPIVAAQHSELSTLVTVPPCATTVAQCTSTTAGTVFTPANTTAANFTETRATGHYDFTADGLHIWTESNTSTDKVAFYAPLGIPLSSAGTLGFSYDNSNAAYLPPSVQLGVDLNNDGVQDGYLVYEPAAYGQNLWASNGIVSHSPAFVGLPTHGGGGSAISGTLNEYLAAYPDAQIMTFGFSLGSGVLGDGVLSSLTVGCKNYTFAPVPSIPTSIETDPSSSSSCTNTGDTGFDSWIFVALNDQVVYKIDGTTVTSAYTAATPGVQVHVTAEAATGFVLVGTHAHEWDLTPASVSHCQLIDLPVVTPVVTQTAATCSAGGSYTLAIAESSTLADHAIWTVDGKTVTAGTYSAPAGTKVHVVVTAIQGSGISGSTTGSQEWTLTIASPSTSCGDLKTLAFTGADGSMGGMLIIALFLLLGGAGVYTASRYRSRES